MEGIQGGAGHSGANICLGPFFQAVEAILWTSPTRNPDTSRQIGYELAHGISGAIQASGMT